MLLDINYNAPYIRANTMGECNIYFSVKMNIKIIV